MKRLIVEPPLAFDEAAEWATDDERAIAGGFAPARAREYLAWRAIVRREIGRDAAIAYNAAGAPMLTNYPLYLSVSLCRERAADSRNPSDSSGRVAVAISDAPCAVDIEPITRNFRRAMPRYLSTAEQQLSDNPLFPAVAWCAKETLFKYAASTTGRSLDLLRDLHIDRIQFPESTSCSTPCGIPENIPCGTLFVDILNEKPIILRFYEHEGFAVVCLFE